MFNCPHTGVALAVLMKLARRGDIHKSARVVVISTANGLKFIDFKRGYHTGNLPSIEPAYAQQPVQLPNDYSAVCEAVDRLSSGKS